MIMKWSQVYWLFLRRIAVPGIFVFLIYSSLQSPIDTGSRDFVTVYSHADDPAATLGLYDSTTWTSLDELARLRAIAEEKTRNRQNTIYFLHVHKAGGTTVCRAAHVERFALAPTQANCAATRYEFPQALYDGSRKWLQLGRMSITAQEDWSLHTQDHDGRRIQFVSNEFSPVIHMPLPGTFTYIMTFREPLDRVYSHFRYIKEWYPSFQKHWRNHFTLAPGLAQRPFPWPDFEAYMRDTDRESVETGEMERQEGLHGQLYPTSLGNSNYHLHMLTSCGSQCTEASLSLAKHRLEGYFSVVLILERLKETLPQLTDTLLWTSARLSIKTQENTNAGDRGARGALRYCPKCIEELIELNRLDLELYAFANDVATARLANLFKPNS